jgi:HAD superfamily hydrolase (TIGR01484 family)
LPDNIQLLVFDIDGVLTDGEAKPLDLPLLAQLANMNQAARRRSHLPSVTLCTGRPAPYVEMMLQAIDGHLPAIFENGAGLYIPDGYRFLPHPELLGAESRMQTVRARLESNLVQTGAAYFQPGKEYSLTLFADNPGDTDKLFEQAALALGSLRPAVDLVYSSSCLNVLPHGIHKGKGVQFLAAQLGIHPADMLGVGDSDVDTQFLALVGHSAAPANANPQVKEIVQYVAPRATSDGVRDILAHFGF